MGTVPYPHSALHLPSFHALSTPISGKPSFYLKETAYRPLLSSIRANGNRSGRSPNNPSPGRASKGEWSDDNPQSLDGRSSSSSSSKEEILALFKRIQSSISKGETTISKKRISKPAEEKPSAEALLEVLIRSRTQGKGKIEGKTNKLVSPQNEPMKKDDTLPIDLKNRRAPSNFTKRSPITAQSSSTEDKVKLKTEILSVMDDESEHQSNKFEDMKLTELKEVAKSKGIKGYSKLKKSELLELLIRS